MRCTPPLLSLALTLGLSAGAPSRGAETGRAPVAKFDFEGDGRSASGGPALDFRPGSGATYVPGVSGRALRLSADGTEEPLSLDAENFPFRKDRDFTVQVWVKTGMDMKTTAVILSQKEYGDNSLASQKTAGWVLYYHNGTWACNMGAGRRRITWERENGAFMPVNDGRWHLLTMAYDSALGQVRLFHDGDNPAVYSLDDAAGFDFTSTAPLTVGWKDTGKNSREQIRDGAEKLQALADAFRALGVGDPEPGQLLDLVCEPKELFEQKLRESLAGKKTQDTDFAARLKSADLAPVLKARSALMRNPYTVHQIKEFTELAPVASLYALSGGKITVRPEGEKKFLDSERLSRPDMEIDALTVWDRALSPEEVAASYAQMRPQAPATPAPTPGKLVVADWNIWHGGKHFTVAKDGWDSRVRIAEILRREKADVIMMQETYSGGDDIAAELGYHFASTVDGDYLNQGGNISVLSRFPIKELYVPKKASFMNVAVKVPLGPKQDLYVMSNWYGMDSFPAVFDFHKARFAESDTTPTVFAGDFNAVPHTDGGKSPASRAMLAAGFTDAYRSLHPDVAKNPGHSHREGVRIDQIYYKGVALTNTSMEVITSDPAGFPSDHYLLLAKFELKAPESK